ncbi:antibiotic biosynthesis monooxygenase [Vibrio europaeus]|uniref:Antibiotic biosynthesis monooxygenase n=1 Tax=Vibrio europaeus TaxID=300876 RepID=A0A178J9G1_9VIBR|nr:antibiotic biosynthesis monooxygenase [Vibrio europaeus]MDC5704987.1 antibiotic biosynthesis monooxygenase [Vibrio europaeus]MDC5710266.1 antibiotic biosynthesis monooxygenase [Vibrio europaeus]MDC5715356.1 antibiotic biosynthesis monooxygenase [Vibrio europaeus]MDC5719517.1 antibiotic biosynthesis monooxygenase [Vibrio europaeus]MDC5724595.1 antibiotic biosynthesis monooxygenase [Vibrio europaeus]
MSILVQFQFNYAYENSQLIKDFFTEILPDTRTFDGNISAHLFQNSQVDKALVLYEEWQSEAHFKKYIGWRKEIGDFDRLGALLAQEPNISILSKEV